jgi:hypothetical protein
VAVLLAAPALDAREPGQPEITLKLYVHFLHSDESLLNAPPDKTDLEKFVSGTNEIWKSAAIQFKLKRISTYQVASEQAEQRYVALFELDEAAFRREGGQQFVRLLPDLKKGKKAFHIVFLHTMPHGFGGRYLPDHGVVLLPQIKYAKYNRAARQQGATGIRRLEPKVMAHELGHALSLMHERLARNLMTSGPNSRGLPRGTELSDEQIQAARKVASRGRPFIREERPEASAGSGTPNPQANQQPAITRVLSEQQRASFAEAMRATQAEGQALTRQLAEARKEVQESGDQTTEKQLGEVRRLQGELSALRKSVLDRVRPPVTEEQRKQLRRPSSAVQPRS